MRRATSHYLRLVMLAFAAVCAVALNHRHVAVVRVVADAVPPASSGAPVVLVGSHRVVVRERVSLESVHAGASTVASSVAAWLPPVVPARNPLGAWLRATAATLGARPTALVCASVAGIVPAYARLLGTTVAPQAP
ncbi:MAG: hypothetical protein H7330_02460 [Hymenobacteraceae bacterium]|nr:hypothetical protein [Hymenobacteraceae bacterium]